MAFFNPMSKEVSLLIAIHGSAETLRPITDAILARDRAVRASQRGRVDDFGLSTNGGRRVVPLHSLGLPPIRGFRCRVFVAWLESGIKNDRADRANDDAIVTDPKTLEEVEAAAREAHAKLVGA